MQRPEITFYKERLDKDATHKHCCLCQYGKKEGIILWRVEFRGGFFGFHWLLCNRCRFRMFVAMGGKLVPEGLKEPKQRVSNKGRVRWSRYFEMSWDRRAILDAGFDVREYQYNSDAFEFVDGIPRRKRKKKKKRKKRGLA